MTARRAVYFDMETAGLTEAHPTIQLAAIAIDEDSWAELEPFEAKIKFDLAAADAAALAMNNFDPSIWNEKAIPESEAARQFSGLLKRHSSLTMTSKRGLPYSVAKLVGHNAASFDGPRLRSMFARHAIFLQADPRIRDTLQRALWYFDENGIAPPENYRLETLCRYFGVPIAETHEALADVRLAIQLARAIGVRAAA